MQEFKLIFSLDDLESFPGYIFFKDTKLVFLTCSKDFAETTGFKKCSDISGKTIFDLPYECCDVEKKIGTSFPCCHKEKKLKCIDDDKLIIEQGIPLIDIHGIHVKPDGTRHHIIVSKYPAVDKKGSIIGIYGFFHYIDELLQKFTTLKQVDKIRQEMDKHPRKRYPILDTYLTKREAECMVGLIEGQTAKEIARQLVISPKTVEDHIGHVKMKLDCCTRSQLIKILLDSHFPHVLPS